MANQFNRFMLPASTLCLINDQHYWAIEHNDLATTNRRSLYTIGPYLQLDRKLHLIYLDKCSLLNVKHIEFVPPISFSASILLVYVHNDIRPHCTWSHLNNLIIKYFFDWSGTWHAKFHTVSLFRALYSQFCTWNIISYHVKYWKQRTIFLGPPKLKSLAFLAGR